MIIPGPGNGLCWVARIEIDKIEITARKILLLLDKNVTAIVEGTTTKIEKGFVRPPV